ncbi:MAG: flagellar biosynthesis regulator FlaF [Rhodobacteraceae bacterium]|nr:flagellar biosynthesis regulator FlaF [Paracoccaceae bacterium]
MMANAAASGYLATNKKVGTPRTIEYQVFQRVTALLKAAARPETPFSDVAQAVLQNTRLWMVLMVDLASDGNELPDALRANLVSLGNFARKHGNQVLSGEEDVRPLIELNTAVMRGLRGDDGAEKPVET